MLRSRIVIAQIIMEESEKSKKENELKKLNDLERKIKIQDEQTIQNLLKEIGDSNIPFNRFMSVINTKVSFNLSIENTEEE